MNKIKEFIKTEISGWSKFETFFIFSAILIVLATSIYSKDTLVATVSAICGISYTIIAGKGKISCFFIGIIGTLCYSYLSFANAFYGSLILNLGYYFPMEVVGIFTWRNHLKEETKVIEKTVLSNKMRIIYAVLLIIASFITSIILKYFGDTSPVLDAIITVFSVMGMYLTVRRSLEQWVVWMIVDGAAIIMWLKIYLQTGKVLTTAVMWSLYMMVAIYFHFQWKKEIEQYKS